MAGYLLAMVLTFLNVLVTARLMFLSRHDLLLSTVLLVFAAIIATSLGYLLTGGVTSAIARLNRAAAEVAGGDLEVVVPVEGSDEVADLAVSFNEMTSRLRDAERARLEVEAARSHLLTAVGHDLRTPLASVRVIVEALSDGVVDDPETVARYLRTAQGDLNALSHLVDDLFTLAHLESGGVELERQPNSMTDLISDILESFALRAEQQKVTLRGEPCRSADTADFDARYVERALANLVENALRYTPPGGEVVLQDRHVPGGLRVKVSDTGPGIAEADVPRVFDRFYRGEASRSRATGGQRPRAGDRQGRRRGARRQRRGRDRARARHDLLVRRGHPADRQCARRLVRESERHRPRHRRGRRSEGLRSLLPGRGLAQPGDRGERPRAGDRQGRH